MACPFHPAERRRAAALVAAIPDDLFPGSGRRHRQENRKERAKRKPLARYPAETESSDPPTIIHRITKEG
jgi:hypothetical protein